MDTNIYYNPQEQGILITSNFAEIQKWMDLGVNPTIDYKKISVSNLGEFEFSGIAFDHVDNTYFKSIKDIFSRYTFETIGFHHSIADLSDTVFNVKHLIVGDNCKVNLGEGNFINLEEITFLSIKAFKGKIFDNICSVEKLTLWYENKRSNEILSMFPNLKELIINNGSIEGLDLMKNQLLESLELHNCQKLERVVLKKQNQLKKVIAERCKKLDVSNLGDNVTKVG